MSTNKQRKPKFKTTTFSVLGALVSAISVFSLVQNTIDFGLASIFAEFIGYYRNFGKWIFGWIGWPFGVRAPSWLIDCWVLSSVGVGITARAAFRDDFPARPGSHPFFHTSTLILLPLGVISLFGIVCFIGAAFMPVLQIAYRRYGFEIPREQALIVALTIRELVSFTIILFLFFSMNAYGLKTSV